jgi:hypothetical protein
MAHRIETNDKHQATKQAWHGLSEVKPELTLEDNWLTGWEIAPEPLFFKGEVESGFSILQCTDKPEIRIGAPYNPLTFKPIGNADFLQLLRDSIGGTSHKIVSVGSVRNRGRVFLTIELNGMEKFKAAGRECSGFLNFGNGHDKSSVLWVNTSNVCTVCDNTFGMNLFQAENKAQDSKDDLNIRQRHTKNASLKLPEIGKLIDKAVGVQGEFAVAMDSLALQAVTVDKARDIFAGFIGRNVKLEIAEENGGLSTRAGNTVDRLEQLFRGGAGNRGENMADVFSAVSDYYTHESSGGDNLAKQIVSSEFANGAAWRAKTDFWNVTNDTERTFETARHGAALLALS